MSDSKRELLAQALEEASERLMLANPETYGPLMQVVRMRVGGVEYECFAPLIVPTDNDLPGVEAIEFGQIVPMRTVIQWMSASQGLFDKGRSAGYQ